MEVNSLVNGEEFVDIVLYITMEEFLDLEGESRACLSRAVAGHGVPECVSKSGRIWATLVNWGEFVDSACVVVLRILRTEYKM